MGFSRKSMYFTSKPLFVLLTRTHARTRACTHTHTHTHTMQDQNFASTEISMPEEGKHVERYFNP